jgi:hypothetical protein
MQTGEFGRINEALALLGVVIVHIVPPAIDEFETIGLQRHRFTQGWLNGRP